MLFYCALASASVSLSHLRCNDSHSHYPTHASFKNGCAHLNISTHKINVPQPKERQKTNFKRQTAHFSINLDYELSFLVAELKQTLMMIHQVTQTPQHMDCEMSICTFKPEFPPDSSNSYGSLLQGLTFTSSASIFRISIHMVTTHCSLLLKQDANSITQS